MNQSQASVATISVVRLTENSNAGSYVGGQQTNNRDDRSYQRQSLKGVESMGNIKEGLKPLHTNNGEDIDCNIDCIDLGTEDEYASSVYTARSISPTSRYFKSENYFRRMMNYGYLCPILYLMFIFIACKHYKLNSASLIGKGEHQKF